MANYKWIVQTNPVSGREEEYNRWYDEVHIPDVFRVESVIAVQRYKVAEWQYLENDVTVENVKDTNPKFLYTTIYEIETDDLPATYQAIWALMKAGEMSVSSAIDPNDFSALTYAAVSDRVLNSRE